LEHKKESPKKLRKKTGLNGSEKLLKAALHSLEGSKALDIVTIDLAGKSDLADYMVIASGSSNRHVGAIAAKLAEYMKEKGHLPKAPEGFPECDWVLVDNPYVIVHIFRPEIRKFYNLEKMWQADFAAKEAAV